MDHVYARSAMYMFTGLVQMVGFQRVFKYSVIAPKQSLSLSTRMSLKAYGLVIITATPSNPTFRSHQTPNT